MWCLQVHTEWTTRSVTDNNFYHIQVIGTYAVSADWHAFTSSAPGWPHSPVTPQSPVSCHSREHPLADLYDKWFRYHTTHRSCILFRPKTPLFLRKTLSSGFSGASFPFLSCLSFLIPAALANLWPANSKAASSLCLCSSTQSLVSRPMGAVGPSPSSSSSTGSLGSCANIKKYGKKHVAECGVELYTKISSCKCRGHCLFFSGGSERRRSCIVQLNRSHCAFPSGWYGVARDFFIL